MHWRIYVLSVVAITLFVIPNLLWGNLYIVGGDDARLYYLFPQQYLKNFSFNVMSGNTLGGNSGYIPVSYSAPIITVLWILKMLLPMLNTQFVVYGLIFSLGFLFMHLFLQELVTKKTAFNFLSSIVASVFYIWSLYITRTYFQSQFISIFLIMVVPGCLYFFVSGLKKESMPRIIVSALLYSVFSSTVFSFPWFLPVAFTLIPFIVWLIIRYGRYFWKAVIVFIGVSFFCNLYWIIHYIIPIFFKIGETNFVASLETAAFKKQNHDLITALTYLNPPVNQMANFLRTSWQDRQGTTVIQSIGITYLALILIAGAALQKVKKNMRILYLVACANLLISMVFVTPNFGGWSLQLFEFFNDHVPFFGIFRNMYDKFALAMAFNYAFSLFISFVVFEEVKVKSLYRYLCLAVIITITVGTAIPYIHPVYNDAYYSTRISGQMNPDFMHLSEYIKQLNTPQRFVWVPMTFPGYVYLSDPLNQSHFYAGISPLQLFSRSSDLSGFYGLQTPNEPTLNWTVLDLLKNNKFAEVGKIFQRLNVGYVIVNNDPLSKEGLQALDQFNFMDYQNQEYKRIILGRKIRDFGTKYSLYSINSSFTGNTVFLADPVTQERLVNQSITFHRNSDNQYDVVLSNLDKATKLVVLEPFNALWRIRLVNGTRTQTLNTEHSLADRYGNSWKINPNDIAAKYPNFITRGSDGSYIVKLQIYFWPNEFIMPTILFSCLSFGVAICYLLVSIVRSKKRKNI